MLVAGKQCSFIASLVCSSLDHIKLLLGCSEQVLVVLCVASFYPLFILFQVWQQLLDLACKHGSISPQNCKLLRDVLCQETLANLAYYWVATFKLHITFTLFSKVLVRKLGTNRFFCQGISTATPDQLIQYFETLLE